MEEFEIQYHPTNEELFKIIIQLSRFFKEFGDFELFLTPVFKHPPIHGGIDLQDIGLFQELKRLELDTDKKDSSFTDLEGYNMDIPSSRA